MSQLLPERRTETTRERWEPFAGLELASERLRRMLDQTFAGFGPLTSTGDAGSWSPLVDVEEQDDAYVVEADVPGVGRNDVKVELVGNKLVIAGEIKRRERTGMLRRSTRQTGCFDYSVTLPDRVDADKIEGRLVDGVLTVRLPKAETAERRAIELKSS